MSLFLSLTAFEKKNTEKINETVFNGWVCGEIKSFSFYLIFFYALVCKRISKSDKELSLVFHIINYQPQKSIH